MFVCFPVKTGILSQVKFSVLLYGKREEQGAEQLLFLVPAVRTKQLKVVSLGILWIFTGHSGDLKVLTVFSS